MDHQMVGCWDSVLLENESENCFISNLNLRFKRDNIYTYIGSHLISINPYCKPSTIFSPDLINIYTEKSLFQLPPHIYSLTNSVFKSLQDNNEDQCIVMLGESGSGKTENCRMIIKFLSIISGKVVPLQRQRSSTSLISFKSTTNSSSSTPKHKSSTPVNTFHHHEKTSCFKSDGNVKNKKVSRVEFDFSYQKCNDSDYKQDTIKFCPKHNCCNQIMSSSSSNASNPIDIPKRTFLPSNELPTTSRSFTVYESMNRVNQPKIPNCLDLHLDQKQQIKVKCESLDLISVAKESAKNKVRTVDVCSSLDEKIYVRNATDKIDSKKSSAYQMSYSKNNINLDNFKSAKRKVPTKNLSKLHTQLNGLEIQAMKERIAQAEIFLEAMGCAAIERNRDSSRYGKYFDLEIDYRGDLIGGHVMHFLLEKSRVTKSLDRERNFHIFYQLLAGADIHFLKSLKLQRNINKYELLKDTNSDDNDKSQFIRTKKSLEILGFSNDEILSIFKIIAVVLKLGNLNFIPITNIDGTEGCEISNDYEIRDIAQLMDIDEQILFNCLTKSGSSWLQIENGSELDAINANLINKALCRTLYGRLFTFVVSKINDSLKIKNLTNRGRNLGILDFFGFETLDKNSFEQLNINYCNERIHQSYIQTVLKYQQDLYLREGLEWTKIDFYDNQPICELMDKPPYGIYFLMDEPKVTTNEILLQRLGQCWSGHTSFSTQDHIPPNCFQIRHFAGTINYSICGFVEKNTDKIPKHLSSGLYQSKLAIVQNLFPEGNPKRASKKPTNCCSILRTSLQNLLSKVELRKCHYVFCIKSNDRQLPKTFEVSIVQHQVRYMSLMPVVSLWRNGFYFNFSHMKFLNRYKILSPYTWPHFNSNSVVESIAQIIRSVPLPAAEFGIGLTKVFIRSPRTLYELNEFRNLRLNALASLIQKTFRGYSQRTYFCQMKRSQMMISSAWRTWRAKAEYRFAKYKKQVEWAITIIQRCYILWKRRQYLLTLPLRLQSNSMSPICTEWPTAPRFLIETSQLLKSIFHRWRCHKYRKIFDQTARNRMREKVTASILFKDRKASYVRSVSHPFLGDYVRLRQNVQWKKICVENNDQYVVFADIINKIARSSGKFVPILLVLSTSSMLLLDQRTLQVKYRVPASEIYRISLSPFLDDIAVFHVKAEAFPCDESSTSDNPSGCLFQSELGRKKGDFIFQTGHVIEIVTKMFLVIQNATGKPPEINVNTEFDANFGQQTVMMSFKCSGMSELASQQLTRVSRKGNRMEIII
ncbi:CLUMA_CG008268, isoform A [Clunio marinus]|uniref:CLUMA_CG008268, isoform A n=1 Tax=Clunio marinus TaxID=568069 RepID=A0A1J1I749_9DIPT|nr:CLUMA_CG008268, isoform A [Clunio marinus]